MQNQDDIDVSRRRAGLRHLMRAKSITPTTLAHAIRLPSANALYNFLNGSTKSLSLDTIERIMLAFPDVSFRDLVGFDQGALAAAGDLTCDAGGGAPAAPVFVSVEASSALWQPEFELPARQWTLLIPPPPIGLDASALFGVRVKTPGADLLYHDGAVLVCQRLSAGNPAPQAGHRYVVQEKRRKRFRVTIQEARLFDGQIWLWPRSSHPAHQMPTLLVSDLAASAVHSAQRISLKGLVLGSWQPERTPTAQ